MSRIAFSKSPDLVQHFQKVINYNQQIPKLSIEIPAKTAQNVEVSLVSLIDSRKAKNDHLRKVINNYLNKSNDELIDTCLDHLRIISMLVDAKGDWQKVIQNYNLNNSAKIDENSNDSTLNELTKFYDIFQLFENRKSCYFSEQNITRTGAKYAEVLMQILDQSLLPENKSKLFAEYAINFGNLRQIVLESEKWYHKNYTKNVKVLVNGMGKLQITLGKYNGTMGKNNEIILNGSDLFSNFQFKILKSKDNTISIEKGTIDDSPKSIRIYRIRISDTVYCATYIPPLYEWKVTKSEKSTGKCNIFLIDEFIRLFKQYVDSKRIQDSLKEKEYHTEIGLPIQNLGLKDAQVDAKLIVVFYNFSCWDIDDLSYKILLIVSDNLNKNDLIYHAYCLGKSLNAVFKDFSENGKRLIKPCANEEFINLFNQYSVTPFANLLDKMFDGI